MTAKHLNPLFEHDNEEFCFSYPPLLLIIICNILSIFKTYYIMKANVWKLVLVKFMFLIRYVLIMRIINQW